ncbi:ketosteroid isomerase [Phenylobacterium sp. Root77]|jgi:ketosteroid isomerase-like protein|uniref:nuclear transport factor 2 family protein n=1 Tax=unclassified Phenylobacterium TaxID=2640670 RepID=UPI0006F82FA7|nr:MULTISPECIES: nuclear transport factor 2 family protein [unclassified Phenylobacterium]KQW70790.1 ketosteroid isomerase [Phenylobacterium sp. Root1277]KQW90787.1 ketosteroid isomerase [Phenylobacterium sp. Root1290]KRC39580.1 ketosteroid isomerase [Phenylobacterium sp. Root77]
MQSNEVLAFAERFVSAIEGGDVEAVRACYAPDAKIWHNNDGLEQTVDQNIKVLNWFMRKLPDRQYRIVRREALSDGFLQQHVLEATLPDGRPFKMSACCVIRMKDGVITRLDEYIDSAEAAALNGI